jgi:hypothetical protein
MGDLMCVFSRFLYERGEAHERIISGGDARRIGEGRRARERHVYTRWPLTSPLRRVRV